MPQFTFSLRAVLYYTLLTLFFVSYGRTVLTEPGRVKIVYAEDGYLAQEDESILDLTKNAQTVLGEQLEARTVIVQAAHSCIPDRLHA